MRKPQKNENKNISMGDTSGTGTVRQSREHGFTSVFFFFLL